MYKICNLNNKLQLCGLFLEDFQVRTKKIRILGNLGAKVSPKGGGLNERKKGQPSLPLNMLEETF